MSVMVLCTDCKRSKFAHEFYRLNKNRERGWCLACVRAYQRAYYRKLNPKGTRRKYEPQTPEILRAHQEQYQKRKVAKLKARITAQAGD